MPSLFTGSLESLIFKCVAWMPKQNQEDRMNIFRVSYLDWMEDMIWRKRDTENAQNGGE